MATKQSTRQLFRTRQLTIVGMLSSITVVLGLTGYGFIPLPMAKATVMHIPVIIGAVLEGPTVGIMVGFLFGLFSIFQNMVAPNILSFAFLNPLVSVLPRVLIGLVAYYSYKLVPVKNETLKIGVGAALGSLTNTVGVLGMIYVLYAADFAAARGIDPATALAVVSGIAITNGLPEAIISAMITVPVIVMLKKARRM